MKKFSLALILAIMMTSSMVFAASIDYLSNQSAKMMLTLSRTAATDNSADLASFNPAATATFAPGLYIDVSSQYLMKLYEQDYTWPGASKETVKQEEPTNYLPNFYAVYNAGQLGAGKLAGYLQLGIPAGGGTLKWDDGTVGTQNALFGIPALLTGNPLAAQSPDSQSVEGTSLYYGIGFGVAYAAKDDIVSVSLGGRVLIGQKNLKLKGGYSPTGSLSGLSMSVDFDYSATGFAPIIGFDVKPIENLTFAVRYEFETVMKFKYEENKIRDNMGGTFVPQIRSGLANNFGIGDGLEFKHNMPALLSLGVEYKVMPELTVLASPTFYYLSQVQSGNDVFNSDWFGTGYDLSIGATYNVMRELKVGLGFTYTEMGVKDAYYESGDLTGTVQMPLSSFTIGCGGTYSVENIDVTLGFFWQHALAQSFDIPTVTGFSAKTEYRKDVISIGVGLGYKVF